MRLKTLVLLVASLLPTMAFVVSHGRRTRTTTRMVSTDNLTETAAPSKAMDILTALSTRYGEGDWAKTRNYVYRSKDKLTLQQVEDVLDFLESNFESSLIASILQSSPRILSKNPKSKLKPTAKFLQQLYGRDLFREAVSRNPDLLLSSGLGYDTTNNQVESYLKEELQMGKTNLKKLKQSAPFFFQISRIKIQAVATHLMDLLQQGGHSEEEAKKVVAKVMLAHPHLFHLSVKTNLQPRIDFLVNTCKLSSKNVATLIKSSSGILGLSVEDNLKPTLYYLLQLVGEDGDSTGRRALSKCVLSHPPILALSQRNIKMKVDYFDLIDCAGKGDSLAARIALRSPVVYSLSLKDNIIPTVEFLAKVWGTKAPRVEWKDQDLVVMDPASDMLGTLLRDYPGVLTLSLEGNLQPTFNFYNKTRYTTLDEDWNLVKDKPKVRGRYIAASLFHRLLPRWHYSMERQTTSAKPPLHLIAGSTDASFCELLQLDPEDYLEFKEESAPRLKFSSQFDTWIKTGRAIDI
jgi:hypothetical protein